MTNLFSEEEKKKMPKDETPKVFEVVDSESCMYVVAKSRGHARDIYCDETGELFSDTFEYLEISRVKCLDQYAQGFGMINPWEEEYWTRAVYSEGGCFVNPGCQVENDDYKCLTLDEMLSRECRHSDPEKQKECGGFDDERIYVDFSATPSR